ncbi:PREDICTED: uncharacterized protein LOC104793634 [Camelina sativa]|uniref:Uncharacterized protein LOC104793634 n=1 Tax=Camelina sativa TaxID=90675 RepID=A0ABM0ZNQ3_CAMSA|nr:PREDICTED: uncharacterized protein LOC104793634 [Camelina sativa]
MAAAEARAVWQRTVNRCFVQEDAKRAPKFTYCQSSSSSTASSTKQVEDSGSSSRPSSLEPQHHQSSCAGFMPLHRNPNFPDLLPHSTGLWSPHHPFQVVNKKPLEVNNNEVLTEKKPELEAGEKKQRKSYNSESFQEFIELMETRESFGYDESTEKKLNEPAFDPSSPWNPLSNEKAGPWWRTTDKDELASLVAQRSLDYVENCDLPTPQKMKRSYYGSPRDGFRDYSVSNQQTIHEHGPSGANSCKNRTDASSESDLSKSELLEALRHSQTRAREAENMAKEACAEKEHLVKLLFKQASELFGYKQWLQLLQLEALYLQIKNKKVENNNNNNNNSKKSNEPQVSIPWSNCKARKGGRKRRSKSGKTNGAKYAVSLALGMSLVGAGLLLGWTVGWMQMLSF